MFRRCHQPVCNSLNLRILVGQQDFTSFSVCGFSRSLYRQSWVNFDQSVETEKETGEMQHGEMPCLISIIVNHYTCASSSERSVFAAIVAFKSSGGNLSKCYHNLHIRVVWNLLWNRDIFHCYVMSKINVFEYEQIRRKRYIGFFFFLVAISCILILTCLVWRSPSGCVEICHFTYDVVMIYCIRGFTVFWPTIPAFWSTTVMAYVGGSQA